MVLIQCPLLGIPSPCMQGGRKDHTPTLFSSSS